MPRTRTEIRAALDVLADALMDVLAPSAPPLSSSEPPVHEAVESVPDWLTVTEAAAYIRISKGLVYEAVRTGSLRAVRVGRLLRFRRTWLDEWLGAAARV